MEEATVLPGDRWRIRIQVLICGRKATQVQHSRTFLTVLIHSVYLPGRGCKNRTQDAFLLIAAVHSIQ